MCVYTHIHIRVCASLCHNGKHFSITKINLASNLVHLQVLWWSFVLTNLRSQLMTIFFCPPPTTLIVNLGIEPFKTKNVNTEELLFLVIHLKNDATHHYSGIMMVMITTVYYKSTFSSNYHYFLNQVSTETELWEKI